ncbi:serine protease HTRA2, mitochondrial-like [Daphnia pulicaria]|uniref:serine protease HTRA2, mitochondrial-like n=1 Tax=Daphnia pulicaria TaxID=35523 RepID=UPI001EEA37BB|nr:serine protease HTRA2, mitochondrial-like [Daphnia pulicaria]
MSSIYRMIKKLTFINRKFAVLRYNSLKSRNEFLQKYCWCNISWKLAGVALGALLFEFHLHNNKLFATSKSGELNDESPRKKCNFIADVVEKVAPGVVFIEIKSNLRNSFYNFSAPQQTVSHGSGFIIEGDGLIVTNAHVVLGQPNSSVQVKLHDGRMFQGIIENIDTVTDLATVRIQCKGLPTLKLGSSSTVRPGEWVVAVGSPLSLTNTITAGVVSSINRGSSELGLNKGKEMEYIQTDASITFGNSGGPLINLDGEVVGVNAMKVTAGISFAIPIDHVKDFLSILKNCSSNKGVEKENTEKEFKRRYMGVTLLTLTTELITELQLRGTELPPNVKHGVLVWKVVLGSPAHWGGLQPGDVVVSINDKPTINSQDIYKNLEENESQIKISVIRKREKINFLISLED